MKEEICKCGHDKAFHLNEFTGEQRCVYGLTIGEKGIISEGCKCVKFTPLTGSEKKEKKQ